MIALFYSKEKNLLIAGAIAIIAISFLFAAIYVNAVGNIYHVRVGGNDSCDGLGNFDFTGGFTNCALKTIQGAIDAANADATVAGDRIIVHGGTYTGVVSITGAISGAPADTVAAFAIRNMGTATAVNRFTLEGAAGETAVVDGTVANTHAVAIAAWIAGSPYVTLKNLTIQNFNVDPAQTISQIGTVYFNSSPNGEFINNIIRNPNSKNQDHGGEVSFGGSAPSTVTGNDIQGATKNIIWYCCTETAGGTIQNNTVVRVNGSNVNSSGIKLIFFEAENNLMIKNNYFRDDSTVTVLSAGVYPRDSEFYEITGNVFENAGKNSGSAIHLQDSDCSGGSTKGHVDRNGIPTCAENERAKITNNTFVNSGIGLVSCAGCVIENNIFRDVSGSVIATGAAGREVECDLSVPIQPASGGSAPCPSSGGGGGCVYGGMCYGTKDVPASANTNISYNLFYNVGNKVYNGGSNYTLDFTHDVGTNPLFKATGAKPSPYFELQTTPTLSPAIDKGNNAYCAFTPQDGDSTGGAVCDMGAYEFGGGGGGGGQPAPSAGPDINTSSTSNIVLSGSATDSDGDMNDLSWSTVPAGCTATQGSLTNNGSTASRSLTLSSCADGTYTATLTATDPSTSNTDATTVKKDTAGPSLPAGVSASLSGSDVQIIWTASTDAVSGLKDYTVKRSTSLTGTFTAIGTAITASFTDATVSGNTTYYYKVSAQDNFGNASADSAASNGVTTLNTTTVIFQEGVSPTPGYAGTTDNVLLADTPTANSGSGTGVNVGLGGGALRRGLVRFDLAPGGIPVGANIISATLDLTCTPNFSAANTISLYRLLVPWTEMNSTWNNRDIATTWNTSGAGGVGSDRIATASASTAAGACLSATSSVSFALSTTTISLWVDNPTATNFGFVLVGTEGTTDNARIFSSSERATLTDRPRLTIVYGAGGGGDTIAPTMPTNLRVTGIAKSNEHTLPSVATLYFRLARQSALLVFLFGEKILKFPGW